MVAKQWFVGHPDVWNLEYRYLSLQFLEHSKCGAFSSSFCADNEIGFVQARLFG